MRRGGGWSRATSLALGLLALELAAPEAARAQAHEESPSAPPEGLAPGLDPTDRVGEVGLAWAELGATGAAYEGNRIEMLSPTIGASLALAPGWLFTFQWGVAASTLRVSGTVTEGGETTPFVDDQVRFEVANPELTIQAEVEAGPARLRFGLLGTIPMASRPNEPTPEARAGAALVYRTAAGLRGWWSPWRWRPERVGFAAPIRLTVDGTRARFDGDLAAGVLVPVLGDRRQDVDVVLQGALASHAHVAPGVSVGLRVQAVGRLSGPDTAAQGSGLPDIQVAVEPGVAMSIGGGTLTGRLRLNLGTLDGLGGDGGPPLGVLVGYASPF